MNEIIITPYAQDNDAWNNPNQNTQQYDVLPPPGMSQSDWDKAVTDAGTNYNSADPYNAVLALSNTK